MGVSKSPNPPPAASSERAAEGDERPTLIPPFDVGKRARDDLANADRISYSEEVEFDVDYNDDETKVLGSGNGEAMRPEMPTLTDDAELEAARVRSTLTSSPPDLEERLPADRPQEDPVLEIVGDAEAASLDPLDEARVLVASGDEAGALVVAEGILRKDPANFVARMVAEECHRVLVSRYSKRLGSVRRVPKVAMSPERLAMQSLDHRVGFLLALVDGASSIDTILDISAMPAPDVLRIFVDLYERGVIAFDGE